ncbi:MAG: hypothetical protein V3T88_07375 [Nitrosomonadaceae bacterium]
MAQLYTPFLAQAGQAIGSGLAQRMQNELVSDAYMNKPGAMERLMQVNPQAAQKIRSERVSQEQRDLQTQRFEQQRATEETRYAEQQNIAAQQRQTSGEDRMRKIAGENREYVENTLTNAAKMPTFEEASAYVDRRIERHQAFKGQDGFKLTPEVYGQYKQLAASEAGEDDPVQSSKIMAGGLVQLVRKSGAVEVVDQDEANKLLVTAAENRSAELQGRRESERGSAKEATKVSAAAFKGIASARKNIRNMNEGIKLLEGGAKTGAVESILPSIKAASVKLDNLKNRLGLDVIGSVTFGALSEGELALALSTALPTKLDEKELIGWMTEKRDAQMKVAENLEEAALFLGEPGNSIADFIKMKKEKSQDLPQGVSEEDMTETMRVHNMTREQVLNRLRGQ